MEIVEEAGLLAIVGEKEKAFLVPVQNGDALCIAVNGIKPMALCSPWSFTSVEPGILVPQTGSEDLS